MPSARNGWRRIIPLFLSGALQNFKLLLIMTLKSSYQIPPLFLFFDVEYMLIAIRNNVTGEYMPYEDMVEAGKKYGIPVTPIVGISSANTTELLKDIRDIARMEGMNF